MTLSPMAALLLDLVITALWPLVGAAGLGAYSAAPFMTAGLAVGAAAMAPWVLTGGRWRAILSRPAALSLAMMGLFSGAASLIYVAALNYTTPVNAVITAQIEVLYSAALSAYFLGERPTARQSLASLLVVAGTGLIVAHDLSSPRWRGDLMILATPWMFQVSHLFAKRLPRDLDAWTLAGGRCFYGMLWLAPACVLALARGSRWSWEPRALGLLLLQGVLMSSVNLVLWYRAIRGLPLSKATTIVLSYPALTMIFSWLAGRETIRLVQVLGLAATFSGAVWTVRLSASAELEPEVY